MNRKKHVPRIMILAALAALIGVAPAFARENQPRNVDLWNLPELFKSPRFAWVDSTTHIRSLYFEGETYRGHPTRVFAFYATPGTLRDDVSAVRRLPCMVLVHGGGGHAFAEWVEMWAKRGYAAIAMDLVGCGPGETKLPDGGPGQSDEEVFFGIDGPGGDMWTHQAVSAVILAHSLVRSFPEVDPKRTAVTGISWGGYLTCIVAGLDRRFRAAVPVYGCGFLADDSVWVGTFSKMTPEQRGKWVRLFDPSRYVGVVSIPMFFLNGTNDFAYPLDSYTRTYKLIKGQKNIRITVNMLHSHTHGWEPPEIGMFVDSHLRDGAPLPTAATPRITGRRVEMKVKAGTTLVEANLHFTTDTGEVNKRTWLTRRASLNGKTVIADAPPPGTTIWFLTVRDERGAVVSSEPAFVR